MHTKRKKKTSLQKLVIVSIVIYSLFFVFYNFCKLVTMVGWIPENRRELFFWIQDISWVLENGLFGILAGGIIVLQYLVQKNIKQNGSCYLLLTLLEGIKILFIYFILEACLSMDSVLYFSLGIVVVYAIIDMIIFAYLVKLRSPKKLSVTQSIGKMTFVFHTIFATIYTIYSVCLLYLSFAALVNCSLLCVWVALYLIQCGITKFIKIKFLSYPALILLEIIKFPLTALFLMQMIWFVAPLAILMAVLYFVILTYNIIFFIKFIKENKAKNLQQIA